MTVSERIQALRGAMSAAGCDAYILPSSDPHASEYAPAHFTAWQYFSGFPCENSNLVVTADAAAMWVDGRFYGAADAALAGTGIQSMHMGAQGVPDVTAWLADTLQPGQVLGYCAETMPLGQLRELQARRRALPAGRPAMPGVGSRRRPRARARGSGRAPLA